ncbi:hypothetical protein NPIL_326961 [Nephila pilipes]|uniref:Uncharacterized protein n=1 Tax=Nephila pilipes TaxID=299642 RepID=A0A8X6U0B4_NEPPI|nr:hypothetical protein NPIL_326961 [Nephila pilipes]
MFCGRAFVDCFKGLFCEGWNCLWIGKRQFVVEVDDLDSDMVKIVWGIIWYGPTARTAYLRDVGWFVLEFSGVDCGQWLDSSSNGGVICVVAGLYITNPLLLIPE